MRGSLVIFAIILITSSCGFNPFKKKHSKNSIEYFVHGDPLQLIAGSTQNKDSFLHADDLERFNGFHSANAIAFIEREQKETPRPFSEVEAANSTGADDAEIASIFEVQPFVFVKESESRYVYRPEAQEQKYYTLGFAVEDGVLRLTDVDGIVVSVEHYSLKDDGRTMSFLVSYQHPEVGKVLLSLVFADSSVVNPIVRSTDGYQYLVDTVELRWDAPMQLKACGTFSEAETASLKASVASWLSDPDKTADGATTPVSFEITTDFPPFSDTNTQCIQIIRNFRLESSDSYYTAGVTLPTFNSASKVMTDSDVFVFFAHGAVSSEFEGEASPVLMHELGHYFGLGHEFRTDVLGSPLHPSIMAYSRATDSIAEWDYAAIHALYGSYLVDGSAP